MQDCQGQSHKAAKHKEGLCGAGVCRKQLVQALSMSIATLGFQCSRNVLMLGRKSEEVGKRVACIEHAFKVCDSNKQKELDQSQ